MQTFLDTSLIDTIWDWNLRYSIFQLYPLTLPHIDTLSKILLHHLLSFLVIFEQQQRRVTSACFWSLFDHIIDYWLLIIDYCYWLLTIDYWLPLAYCSVWFLFLCEVDFLGYWIFLLEVHSWFLWYLRGFLLKFLGTSDKEIVRHYCLLSSYIESTRAKKWTLYWKYLGLISSSDIHSVRSLLKFFC
jgi:hypothetical protein